MNPQGIEFNNLKEITDFIEMTKTEISQLYVDKYRNDIFIIGKEKDIYYYDEVIKLWVCGTSEVYTVFIADVLFKTGKNLQTALLKIIRESDDLFNDKFDKIKKDVKTMINELDKKAFQDVIIERSTGRLQNNEFVKRLNTKADYLPILNGQKISLITLEITNRTREDYFTFECPVTLVKNTQNAEKYFSQLMPNKENREFLRKVLGYNLTGDTKAQCFFIWYGDGSNGKSKLFSIIKKILNKFYHTCGKGIFQKSNKDPNSPSPDKVALIGMRSGVYTEGDTADEMELGESLIKELSGDDPINARPLFKSPLEFMAQVKLNMLTNYRPYLNGDKSIKRRLKYIFMDTNFTDNVKIKNDVLKDDEFIKLIETEYLSEVFTWIVQGAKLYYQDKRIDMSPEFQRRTDDILDQDDSITSFFVNRCKFDDNDDKITPIRKGDFFDEYKNYCTKNSQRCHPRSTLFKRMDDKHILISKLHGYDVYRGVKIVIDGSDNEVIYGKNKDNVVNNLSINIFDKPQQPTNKTCIIEQLEELNFFNSAIKKIINNHLKNSDDLLSKQETPKNNLSQQQIHKIKKREIYDKDIQKFDDDDINKYIKQRKLEDTLVIDLDQIFKKHF